MVRALFVFALIIAAASAFVSPASHAGMFSFLLVQVLFPNRDKVMTWRSPFRLAVDDNCWSDCQSLSIWRANSCIQFIVCFWLMLFSRSVPVFFVVPRPINECLCCSVIPSICPHSRSKDDPNGNCSWYRHQQCRIQCQCSCYQCQWFRWIPFPSGWTWNYCYYHPCLGPSYLRRVNC